jgi:mono/diheme cytochrome c family protein
MRYFYLILFLAAASLVGVMGLRGTLSRKPPLEIFPDMKRQPKLRPQKPFAFAENQRTSRLPVPGTVHHSALLEDTAVATGHEPGTTNFVVVNPLPITAELMAKGRERYTIYCSPCHSPVGDGNGIVTKYGLLKAGNYHDPRIIRMTDGEIFNTITKGKNQMASYASQISVTNRWAIIAYVRALERARLGDLADVPAENRLGLKQ